MGRVIKPDSCMAIDGEGMPLQGHPFEKGNLYIQFSVVFPDTLAPEQVGAEGTGQCIAHAATAALLGGGLRVSLR